MSAGYVTLPAALPLECGQLFASPAVAFETYGELRGDNGVLLLHGISRSHRAATKPGKAAYEPDGWWWDVVAPGGALDPSAFCVISANLLGSPFGSSSPYSVDHLGRPMRAEFPTVSVTDCARAMASLIKSLGVKRLRAAVGVSLGGMVALRLAALFPEVVPASVAIAAPLVLPESIRGQLGLTRQVLASDASFRDGEYRNGEEVAGILRRVRITSLRDLYPRDMLVNRHGSAFAAERALEEEAEVFSRKFDANCYAALCQCAASCDMTDLIEEFPGRVLLVGCSSDDFAPPSRVREAYHALTAVGARATYWELNSDAGHRAHYLEAARLNAPLREFLRAR